MKNRAKKEDQNNKIIKEFTNNVLQKIDTLTTTINNKTFTIETSKKYNETITEELIQNFLKNFDNNILTSIRDNVQNINTKIEALSQSNSNSNTVNTSNINVNTSNYETLLTTNNELLTNIFGVLQSNTNVLQSIQQTLPSSTLTNDILANNLSKIYEYFTINNDKLTEINTHLTEFKLSVETVNNTSIKKIEEGILNLYTKQLDTPNPVISTSTSTTTSSTEYTNFFNGLNKYLTTDQRAKTLLLKPINDQTTILTNIKDNNTETKRQLDDFSKNFDELKQSIKQYIEQKPVQQQTIEQISPITQPTNTITITQPQQETKLQQQTITYTQTSLKDTSVMTQQKLPAAIPGINVIGNKADRLNNAVFSVNSTQQSLVSDVPNVMGLNIPRIDQTKAQTEELRAILLMANTLHSIKDILSNHITYIKDEKEREKLYKDTLENEELSDILKGGSKDKLDLLDQNKKNNDELVNILLKAQSGGVAASASSGILDTAQDLYDLLPKKYKAKLGGKALKAGSKVLKRIPGGAILRRGASRILPRVGAKIAGRAGARIATRLAAGGARTIPVVGQLATVAMARI